MNTLKDVLLISIGVFCASIGLECFLVPNQLLDGGVTGVSFIIQIVRMESFSADLCD